jgi:hypothetical protein
MRSTAVKLWEPWQRRVAPHRCRMDALQSMGGTRISFALSVGSCNAFSSLVPRRRLEMTTFAAVSPTALAGSDALIGTSVRQFGINSERVKAELRRKAEQRRRLPLSKRAQKEQARLTSFSYQRDPARKKWKGPFDHNVQNNVKLQICHNETDLILDPDDLFFTNSKFDVEHIKRAVEEVFDTSKEIEYFEDQTWKPLRDLTDILEYRGGRIPLKIRVPECYDETPLPEGYMDDPVNLDETDEEEGYWGDMIQALIKDLKASGYYRSDVKRDSMENAEHEIRTVDWVLQRAAENPKLQSMLLGNVGALDHLVEYLNYDFVWKRYA